MVCPQLEKGLVVGKQ